ncbi:uncharacterized protein LOC131159180 [Malania oleifera]|uniref:uncharacterized protein LOC131159180 n=1 Tax=Malania oleifera TaxID=397392 RepID=UPI0025ADE143|nr:uncharacterized protein LOC131159180 [Malania oleifera]
MAAVCGGLLPNTVPIHKPHCLYSFSPIRSKPSARRAPSAVIRGDSMAAERLEIKIEKNPPESKLAQLGVRSWPKWGCPPSKFPWTYDAKETCYLLEGKVKVTPAGSEKSVEIGAGDLVEFPKGMSCTWDVSVAVDKHYNFK